MDPAELARALASAETIAREAGKILLEGWDKRPAVQWKSVEQDLVTEFDKRAEAAVAARLREVFPGDAVVGEEGTATSGTGDRVWYVDPLDGTVNFAHGLPLFAVSLGLAVAGQPVLGVVHAPALGFTFTGAPGLGAFRDGAPISPSPIDRLERSLLVTGFPTALAAREENMPAWDAFMRSCQGLRRMGSAALDLCFVACGWLEGTWQRAVQPWDVVGAAAICTAAGCSVSDLDGRALDIASGRILASNELIHAQMIAVLRQAG
jgi:myo-inositol-1(or 4)-monophosphatase